MSNKITLHYMTVTVDDRIRGWIINLYWPYCNTARCTYLCNYKSRLHSVDLDEVYLGAEGLAGVLQLRPGQGEGEGEECAGGERRPHDGGRLAWPGWYLYWRRAAGLQHYCRLCSEQCCTHSTTLLHHSAFAATLWWKSIYMNLYLSIYFLFCTCIKASQCNAGAAIISRWLLLFL